MGRRAGLRRHDRRPRRAGRPGRRRRRGAPLGRGRRARRGGHHATPRRLAAGRVRPARAGRRARRPRPSSSSPTTARSTGTLGAADLDAALVEAATEALRRGLSRTVELGGRSLFVEVFPVRPRLVVVGGGGGRPLARPARTRARLRDRRHRRPGGVRDAGALPRRRPAGRRLAGRGRRRDRPRAERRRRRPVARREVRRAGDRRGAPPRLPLRRRGRLAEDAGATAARGCSRPASARRTWLGCAARSGSTSAGARRPRRRWRSSPRSSPSATAALACRCTNGCRRSPDRGDEATARPRRWEAAS